MQMHDDILELLPKIRHAWGADTSADPTGWTPENPSWGQSEITALLLQDYMGGQICEGRYILPSGDFGPHVWNDIEGSTFDATSQQFPKGTRVVGANGRAQRRALLKDPVTAMRYQKLKNRIS